VIALSHAAMLALPPEELFTVAVDEAEQPVAAVTVTLRFTVPLVPVVL